jgi:tetratricopeptide (TPR) repeat protein
VHITAALALVAVLSHVWPAIIPWIFTLYLTWSPWHYTGQNFGLTMMFVRRNGVAPTDGERRRLYTAFLASYALLFISFHTGPSSDPLIRSLGIPVAIATPARVLLLIVTLMLGVTTVARWFRRTGATAMLAPFALVVTQATWFVAPAIAEWASGGQPMPTRYSAGVLAVMHAAQYLWITSYYAKREATAALGRWRPWTYAATLVVGGIALFVPGPWLASYLFHADFTQSVLIFTAIVNIHHFLLDGAIWKLRDTRIASLLVDSRTRASAAATDAALAVHHATRWMVGDSRWARTLRVATLVTLIAWASLDQARFILGTNDHDLSALARAAALNPYDGSVQRRTARVLIEERRYQEAYVEYQQYLAMHPRDGEALLNSGVLAMRLGQNDDAVARWESIAETDAARPAARRYLGQLWATRADALEHAGRTADAAQAFHYALTLDEQDGDPTTLGVDWFNYGQFLRTHQSPAPLVLACLMRAEILLTSRADARAVTVQQARSEVEHEHPDAAVIVHQAPDSTLTAARTLYSR